MGTSLRPHCRDPASSDPPRRFIGSKLALRSAVPKCRAVLGAFLSGRGRSFRGRRARPSTRPLGRRFGPVVRCAFSLVLLAGAVCVLIYLSWDQLAGRRLELDRAADPAGTPGVSLERRRSTASPGGSADLDAGGNTSTRPEPPSSGTTGDQASELDGTQVALILSAGVLAGGFVIGRNLVRRIRMTTAQPAAPDPDADPDSLRSPRPLSPPSDPERGAPTIRPVTASSGPGRPPVATGSMDPIAEPTGLQARLTSSTPHTSVADEEDVGTDPFALANRITHRTRARLQWHGHDISCETLELSMLELMCSYPLDAAPPPVAGAPATVTLLLDGGLAQLDAQISGSRVHDGHGRVLLQFSQLDPAHRSLIAAVLTPRPFA